MYIDLINEKLKYYIGKYSHDIIYDAMYYSVEAGGKRVRPVLLLKTCRSLSGDIEHATPFACALEMIHTYSLIHDDLPCMDDDDLRRGKPTCHKVFGEAMALLAGDGLLNLAYEIMLDEILKFPEKNIVRAAKIIANSSGVGGMIGGQVMDIISEDTPISEDELLFIHKNKTAALITAALLAGAHIAGAPKEVIADLKKAGYNIGIAFQIKDDILDVEGDSKELGKNTFSDTKNNKATYVNLHSLEKAKEDFIELSQEAINLINKATGDEDLMRYCESLMNRSK